MPLPISTEMFDHYFKELQIDECTFTLKGDNPNEDVLYYYCNLDNDEFQLGIVGDIPTNYLTNKTL